MKQAFDNHEDLKDIHVEVKNCIARLTGTVPSGIQRLEAAIVARSTQGVCSVQDDVRIADLAAVRTEENGSCLEENTYGAPA